MGHSLSLAASPSQPVAVGLSSVFLEKMIEGETNTSGELQEPAEADLTNTL
jgi:hypothetical protein